MRCQGVENFRVALGPCIVNRDTFEAPFLAVAHQVAIITVHQERVLRSAARTLPGHEMLRHHVGIERGRIATDLDLEIARRVTGVERTDQRKDDFKDGVPSGQYGEIQAELLTRGREIENAVFGNRGRQRIGITVVETERVAMQCIGDFESVVGQLR